METTGYAKHYNGPTGSPTMQSNGPASAPRDRNDSEMLTDRVDATLTQASDLANRLTTFADRLVGAIPQPANSEGGKAIGSSGFAHAMNARVDGINRELDRAFEALQRMEKFL